MVFCIVNITRDRNCYKIGIFLTRKFWKAEGKSVRVNRQLKAKTISGFLRFNCHLGGFIRLAVSVNQYMNMSIRAHREDRKVNRPLKAF